MKGVGIWGSESVLRVLERGVWSNVAFTLTFVVVRS